MVKKMSPSKQLLISPTINEKLARYHQHSLNKNNKIVRSLLERQNKKQISVNFKQLVDYTNGDFATHRIHKYPAKVIPHIPHLFIHNSIFSTEGDFVCDPFCGTGTVLLESILAQRNALGIELNPVARLISKVKTTPIDPSLLLDSFNTLKKTFQMRQRIEPPNFHNIDYWFSKKTKNDLTRISNCLNESFFDNKDIYDFFLVCFSSIIRKVSKADPRINQPVYSKYMRTHYDDAAIDTFDVFTKQVFQNLDRMKELFYMCPRNTRSIVIEGDSRKTKFKKNVQLILTSPPYLNAQEYFRSTRLEYYWLGMHKKFDANSLMKNSVGSEGIRRTTHFEIQETGIKDIDCIVATILKKSKMHAYITYKYFDDIIKMIYKMSQVLNHDGHLVIVIGNNQICGRRVPSNKIIRQIAISLGLDIKMELVDEIKSYGLMTKRNNSSDLINRESILVITKS